MRSAQKGNVLIYVLVAIVLFAAISFVITRQMGQESGASKMTQNRADLHAGELLEHVSAVRNVLEQMQGLGNVAVADFDFTKQGEAGYDNAPFRGKVYHPAGGGLGTFLGSDDIYASGSLERGWQAQQNNNVSWSYTPAPDVLFSFVDVAMPVCAAINKRLYKSADIPVYNAAAASVFMKDGTQDFSSAQCADCAARASLCVQDSTGAYVFYNVIVAQ